ncbi:MAG: cytidylate kinase-like family protein [Faecalibacterium sp.]|nr:cytidylate kinase-like family protein [Ruminococcus sp.]MCM1392057.1 cytidylate kinase-like family protein [Ruminococcus sp.]MCM1485834.1 cytidylate kinase-like family protein [Faecalibacterium sp.]
MKSSNCCEQKGIPMDKSKQLIISIGREFGSGGHQIATLLAEKFGLELYDRNIMFEIAKKKGVDHAALERYDEVPRSRLFSRSVNGHSSSPAEAIANMQFDFLREKAQNGDSFVVVGRCSEIVLQDFPNLVTIFVLADPKAKAKRTMDAGNISEKEAYDLMQRKDRYRKSYHNYYCSCKWGDSRSYDISVNSTKLDIEATADMLADYINKRMNND